MLNKKDILIETFRGGSPKLESWVKMTHLPTGLVVEVNETRSQHRNREIARKRLQQLVDSSSIDKQSE